MTASVSRIFATTFTSPTAAAAYEPPYRAVTSASAREELRFDTVLPGVFDST